MNEVWNCRIGGVNYCEINHAKLIKIFSNRHRARFLSWRYHLALDAVIASRALSAFIGPMLTALALELASIAVIWQAYGALYGDKAQQYFATGIGLGLASANVAIAILGKLAGPPLPGGTITVASTFLIIAVISSNAPTETSSNCFK